MNSGESNLALEIRELHKEYSGLAALDSVSLRIHRGEVFGLVGPNGAGKTTLIKSILGIVRPNRGEVRVEGIDALALPVEARRRMSYLPSDSNLYLNMTGHGFLDFALSFYSSPDQNLLQQLMDEFKLPLEKKVRTYSMGMKRKLLVLQALCANTPLLLLDEATEALDPTSRIQLLSLLRRLTTQGKTILFSSHQLDEVERLCDRIAFLHKGKILDEGSVKEIQQKSRRLVRLRLRDGTTTLPASLAGIRNVQKKNDYLLLEIDDDPSEALRSLSQLPVASLEYNRARLSDLYADLYGVQP